VMWSIGNEIGEQRRPDGVSVARFLTDTCHREDPTRPVTAGFNMSEDAITNGLAAVVDVPGWNYKPHRYHAYHEALPSKPMLGAETASCVSSRGEYFFPVEEERNRLRESLQVTSYDVSAPPWAYPAEYEFAALDACPFMMGEFVWTGFDYLGEPTPYKNEWPSRSSYFGIIDLAGFPKDRFYLYRSRWAPEKETLHLLPHWTWPGREGEVTPVHCYTNYPAAELFLNGQSLGVRRKTRAQNGEEAVPEPREGKALTSIWGAYRLVWDEVRYEPGVLKVVAFDEAGQPVEEKEVHTAGAPARLEAVVDHAAISADGEDLAFVTVRVLDAEGNLCPHAADQIQFSIEGPGEIAGVDNGDATSLEPFQASQRRAFHGLCLAIVRLKENTSGSIKLRITAEGMEETGVVIECK